MTRWRGLISLFHTRFVHAFACSCIYFWFYSFDCSWGEIEYLPVHLTKISSQPLVSPIQFRRANDLGMKDAWIIASIVAGLFFLLTLTPAKAGIGHDNYSIQAHKYLIRKNQGA